MPTFPDARRAQAGTSLAEVMIVLVVLGLLTTMAWPRFDVACEATRAEQATGVLRSLWLAQRMHWVEHNAFADSIEDLADQDLIEPAVASFAQPFVFTVLSADEAGFALQAERAGSDDWHGTLVLDETGSLTGQVQDGKGHHVVPSL